jgi:hypothetical protein
LSTKTKHETMRHRHSETSTVQRRVESKERGKAAAQRPESRVGASGEQSEIVASGEQREKVASGE